MIYFDKPGEKEDHAKKIQKSFPRCQTIRCSIHKKDPAFLGRRFVHSQYACHLKIKFYFIYFKYSI
jgi:hypothetical protein